MIVLKGDYRIVVNKFLKGLLYSLVVVLVTLFINYVSGNIFPPGYSFLGALIVIILQAILKSIEQYKPEYDQQFQWFFMKVIDLILKKKPTPQ